jgi:hypothetical protein
MALSSYRRKRRSLVAGEDGQPTLTTRARDDDVREHD